MKRIALLATLALLSSAAMASSCPKLWKQIDAAMPSAKLSAAQMTQVNKLRSDGEAMHKAGKHADSVATLNKAKKMLGIQ